MFPYIPSPVKFEYDSLFKAIINPSGRMQYYYVKRNNKQQRITKNEFSNIYNNANIIAIRPIQDPSNDFPIQMELYVKGKIESKSLSDD